MLNAKNRLENAMADGEKEFKREVMALCKEAIVSCGWLTMADLADVRSGRTSAGMAIEFNRQGRKVDIDRLAAELEALAADK